MTLDEIIGYYESDQKYFLVLFVAAAKTFEIYVRSDKMDDFQNAKEEILNKLVEWRRDFHKYPESGWTEFRTAALVAKHLTALGYEITMGKEATKQEYMMGVPDSESLAKHQERAVSQGADSRFVAMMTGGHTGLWADLRCGDGPTIALRFDMDANDIEESEESTHVPFAKKFSSVNRGVMHACGHDGHTAVGLLIAELIAKHKSTLKGKIRLIFQPAEEGVRGARAMVAAGAVQNVDFIIGFHLGFQAERTGVLVSGTRDFLATSKLNVWYEGAPAHAGAYPEKGKNALLAACSAVLNLHAISRHSSGATRITVGTLNAGQGRNVIPPNAFFEMETRGVTSELDDYMRTEAERIIAASAALWDVKYRMEMAGGTKSGESSLGLAGLVTGAAKQIEAFDEVRESSSFGASEDFAHFMSVVQSSGGYGTYIQVGADLASGHHTSCFNFDERSMLHATELIFKVVKALLDNQQKFTQEN